MILTKKRRRYEEERRRKMGEEQMKLDEERRKIQEDRLRLEAERNRQMANQRPYEEIPKIPDNSRLYEEQKQDLVDQMEYLKDQRQKFRNEIKKYEQGQKMLEEENIRIIEEEREKDRLRASKQQSLYDTFSYKDTEVKTFYSGYVQKKYTNAAIPFPERSTFTINIKNEQRNLIDNRGSNIKYNEINNSLYPACGKMLSSHIKNSQYNYVQIDNLCPGCGRMMQQA